jgi:lipopolysaccharide transport protein LptA
MTRRWATTAILFALMLGSVYGQGTAPSTIVPRAQTKDQPAKKSSTEKVSAQTPKAPSGSPTKSGGKSEAPEEPIVTEIYADKTIFDSAKSIGTFIGHVIVTDPRFNIQGDKLTVFISKTQNEGFEKAVVEGNVGVVRDRPGPNGGPPEHMVGRSEKAVYTASDGRFELTGNPRVQQGLNTHVATSPDTVMILNEEGQLETHGPSRTEIRQQPNVDKTPSKP